jgi:hypothetical protein
MPRQYVPIIAVLIPMLVLASAPARAQSHKDSTSHFCRNAIYVEALGQGGIYSVNFDHRFTKEIGFRAGFTTWSWMTGLPLKVNYLGPGPVDHFEIGIGALVGLSTLNLPSPFENGLNRGHIIGTGTVGYRYQPDNGGLVFRLDFTPWFGYKYFEAWAGVSLGYAF